MIKRLLVVGITTALLVGCSSKKYFEPKTSVADARYNGSYLTSIIDQTRDGATLSDGRVITKVDGLLQSGKLPKGFRYINSTADTIISADILGNLYLMSKSDFSVQKKIKFDTQILSATKDGSLLALVDAKNNIFLYDISLSKLLYKEQLHKTVAVDTRLANPIFLNDIIVYPTLDGRLLVMNKFEKRVLRDIAISDNDIFNNVIYMSVSGDVLVASTRTKVIAVTTNDIKTYKEGVKDIIYDTNKVYVFTKDGRVLLLSDSLQKQAELKLKNAIFSGAVAGANKLYVVEKMGYLIEIEKDLSSYKVKKLDDEVKSPVFGANKRVYIGDKYILLP